MFLFASLFLYQFCKLVTLFILSSHVFSFHCCKYFGNVLSRNFCFNLGIIFLSEPTREIQRKPFVNLLNGLRTNIFSNVSHNFLFLFVLLPLRACVSISLILLYKADLNTFLRSSFAFRDMISCNLSLMNYCIIRALLSYLVEYARCNHLRKYAFLQSEFK